MKKFFMRKRAAVLGLVACLAIAGAAIAYWTQNGSGSGSATAGDTTAVTVNQTSTVSNLYPDGPAQALSGNFDNTNDSAVKVGSVEVTSITTDQDGCDGTDFKVEGSAVVNAEIPKGNSVGNWSGLTVRMINKSTNQDACKNATLTIDYSVSPAA
jgi:hypothetical protein